MKPSAVLLTRVTAVEGGANVVREVWRKQDGSRELRVLDDHGRLIRWGLIPDRLLRSCDPPGLERDENGLPRRLFVG